MLVEVQVTQDHINRGEKQNCSRCPVALALSSLVKDRVRVHVTQEDVRFVLDPDRIYIEFLPEKAVCFIGGFDFFEVGDDYVPAPFSFNLEIPEGFLKHEMS